MKKEIPKFSLHNINWYRRSFKNKLLFWVISIFVVIYGAMLFFIYNKTSDALLQTTIHELDSSTAILAMALYRNYELENDAREIQSFIIGAQNYQRDFLEVSVVNSDMLVISSTIEEKLFQQVVGDDYIRASQNEIIYSSDLETARPYIKMLYPISAGQGNNHTTIGVIETKLDVTTQVQSVKRTLWLTLFAGISIILALFFVISLLCKKLTEPIQNLYEGMTRVDENKLDVFVKPTWQDEVGYLTNRFNQMIASLKVSREKLSEMMAASIRFVPIQFLQMLGKDNIKDVDLGSANLKHITVLFLDIRDFTGMSHLMSADEVLHFLNELHQGFLPIIAKHKGFVDKYIGDAIMAIFPNSSTDAVLAGVDMLKRVQQYNDTTEKKRAPLKVGIGINFGEAIIGTIGDYKRMDTTVIGDMVNKASRFEGLTKSHDHAMVFSKEIYEQLPSHLKNELAIKDLGHVSIRGYYDPVHIFGICNGI